MSTSAYCTEPCNHDRCNQSTPKNLGKFTDEELRAELKRREDEAAAERERVYQAKLQQLRVLFRDFQYPLEMFLHLMLPDHGRNTCKDDAFMNHVNVDRCTRCTVNWLLEQQDYEQLFDRLALSISGC